jgi:hypothetical protein
MRISGSSKWKNEDQNLAYKCYPVFWIRILISGSVSRQVKMVPKKKEKKTLNPKNLDLNYWC